MVEIPDGGGHDPESRENDEVKGWEAKQYFKYMQFSPILATNVKVICMNVLER